MMLTKAHEVPTHFYRFTRDQQQPSGGEARDLWNSIKKLVEARKPLWSNAPDWAGFLAMDADGEWNWFKEEPRLSPIGIWIWGYTSAHVAERAKRKDSDLKQGEYYEWWTESLECRPLAMPVGTSVGTSVDTNTPVFTSVDTPVFTSTDHPKDVSKITMNFTDTIWGWMVNSQINKGELHDLLLEYLDAVEEQNYE